jgi:hypothetical protein
MPLEEASMNFDAEEVGPFLGRLTSKLPILPPYDCERLAREIAAVPVTRVGRWTFDVVYDQRHVPLEVRAAMENFNAPDVYFYTVPELADQIQAEMRLFASARAPAPPRRTIIEPSLVWSLFVT